MRKTVIFVSVLVALTHYSFSFAGGVPATDEQNSDGNSAIPVNLKDPELIEEGKAIFHSTCADYCHGHEPALFIGRGDELEPEYIYKTIFEGGKGATPMPPWGEVFSEQEIWELVSYIKFLGTQE